MSNWNLPDGCKDTDIPGNRPDDIAFEKWLESHLESIYIDWCNDGNYTMTDNPDSEFEENSDFRNHVEALYEGSW